MRSHRRLMALAASLLSWAACAGCSNPNKTFVRQVSDTFGGTNNDAANFGVPRPYRRPMLPTVGTWFTAATFNRNIIIDSFRQPLHGQFFGEGGGILHFGQAWFLWPTPVSPAWSDEIERMHERLERDKVAILPPIKGEFAPIFCMDPPTEKEMYEVLPPIPHGVPFIREVQRKNVRFSFEKIADQIDECRFFPLAGPCQLHHCHFKCTIWWEETVTSAWPVPWSTTDQKQEVVYIDKDHLHRCGEPGNLTGPGGDMESYGGYAPAAAHGQH